MRARITAAGGLLAAALASLGADSRAWAEEPPGAPAAPPEAARPAAPAAAPPARAAGRGAVVVAVGEDSARAARALALAIYRDPALRPGIDDATARALAGEPPPEGAAARVKELAEVRRSVAGAGSDLIARRLLASLGAEAGAALVVAVSVAAGRPVARVLRVGGASYAPIELGATIQGPGPDAAPADASIAWPGAADAVRGLLPAGAAPAPAPVVPRAERGAAPPAVAPRDEAAGKPVWTSPWFWGSLGVVAAVGVTVFALSQANEGETEVVHLRGRIAP